MPLFIVGLLKRTIYNKETKREAINERSQGGHKKTLTADSAPDPFFLSLGIFLTVLFFTEKVIYTSAA